jgi:hypothetical protein
LTGPQKLKSIQWITNTSSLSELAKSTPTLLAFMKPKLTMKYKEVEVEKTERVRISLESAFSSPFLYRGQGGGCLLSSLQTKWEVPQGDLPEFPPWSF